MYCGILVERLNMKRKPNCLCATCSKNIYRRPSQITGGNVYCSSQCTGKAQQKNKQCPICSKTFIGAKKTCSRGCANVARTGIKYTHEGKYNKAYKGRALKEKISISRNGECERCGESNYSILQVHHIIERHKGGSDELKNLELLCPNCHATHHLGKSLFRDKKNAKVARTIK